MNKPAPETQKTKTAKKPAAGAKAEASLRETWDGLDETAAESFPASDAPTSWAGKDIAPQDRKDQKS